MRRLTGATIITALVLAAGPASAVVDKFNITPEEHAACDGDAIRLCSHTYPNEDELLACMKANRDQLAPVCLATFKAGLQRRHMRM